MRNDASGGTHRRAELAQRPTQCLHKGANQRVQLVTVKYACRGENVGNGVVRLKQKKPLDSFVIQHQIAC